MSALYRRTYVSLVVTSDLFKFDTPRTEHMFHIGWKWQNMLDIVNVNVCDGAHSSGTRTIKKQTDFVWSLFTLWVCVFGLPWAHAHWCPNCVLYLPHFFVIRNLYVFDRMLMTRRNAWFHLYLISIHLELVMLMILFWCAITSIFTCNSDGFMHMHVPEVSNQSDEFSHLYGILVQIRLCQWFAKFNDLNSHYVNQNAPMGGITNFCTDTKMHYLHNFHENSWLEFVISLRCMAPVHNGHSKLLRVETTTTIISSMVRWKWICNCNHRNAIQCGMIEIVHAKCFSHSAWADYIHQF